MTSITHIHPYTATYDEDRRKLYGQPGSVWTVWDVLTSMANVKTGKAWPSFSWIQKVTGLCRSAVKKAIRTLRELGILQSEERPGTTPMYSVRLASQPSSAQSSPAPSRPRGNNKPLREAAPAPAQRETTPPQREEAPEADAGRVPGRIADEAASEAITALERNGVPLPQIIETIAGTLAPYQVPADPARFPAGRMHPGERALNPAGKWDEAVARIVAAQWGTSAKASIVRRFCSLIAPAVSTGEVTAGMIGSAVGSPGRDRGFYGDGAALRLARLLHARRSEFSRLVESAEHRGWRGQQCPARLPSNPQYFLPQNQESISA